MPANSRVKTRAAAVPVPQSEAEAADYIAQIGQAQRRRAVIEAEMNDRMAEIKATAEAEAKPLAEMIVARTKGLATWCAANRERLTAGGKVKFHKFGTGEVSWRIRPPKVTVRGIDAVIEAAKALSLGRFVRVREEVDKAAMLAEPEVATRLAGVHIGSAGEDFVVKPFETELEEVAS